MYVVSERVDAVIGWRRAWDLGDLASRPDEMEIELREERHVA